jgi:predicted nucleic acid-binding protein
MVPTPPASVIAWLNRQDTLDLYLSTVTIAEIGYGLWVLPDGKRRRALEDRFAKFIAAGFEHRILNFDERAARSTQKLWVTAGRWVGHSVFSTVRLHRSRG